MSLRDTRDIGTAKIVMVGGGGGGGSTALSDLTDTSISSPSNGQVLEYDSTAQKWKNASLDIGGNVFMYDITSMHTESGGTREIDVQAGADYNRNGLFIISTVNLDGTTSGTWTLSLQNQNVTPSAVVNRVLIDDRGNNYTAPLEEDTALLIQIYNTYAVVLGVVHYDKGSKGQAFAYDITSMSTPTTTTHEFIVEVDEDYDKNGLFFISTTTLGSTTSTTWTMTLTNPSVTGASISRVLVDMNMNNYTAEIEDNTTLVIDVDGQYAMVRGVLRYNGGSGASALSDLTDTTITTPSNGQALVYNGATQKWENQAVSVGVTDVSWDSTNKILKQTKNGTASNVVYGSTILDGLTSSQVTTALGYTPPQQDTNTHRPIKVNGTQVLGDNVTPLDLVAGSNVTITNSGGTVQISSSGGGSGTTMSKTRYQVQASSWSSTTTDGYYTYAVSLSPSLSDSYSPNIFLADNSSIDPTPTASEVEAFECIDRAYMQSNVLELYAKVKPTSNFYIWIAGVNA